MAKTYRHILMASFFALLAVFTVSIVMVEAGTGAWAAVIILGTLATLSVIFGVPLDNATLRKGDWEVSFEFSKWGPVFPRNQDDDG